MRFISWLEKKASFWQIIGLIITFVVMYILWSLGVRWIFNTLGIVYPPPRIDAKRELSLFAILLAPFLEEGVFRALPLWFVLKVKDSTRVAIVVALIVSVLFGLLHNLHIFYVLTAGFGGFGYSLLFLKSGGRQGKIIEGMTASSITHLLYNVVFLFVLE